MTLIPFPAGEEVPSLHESQHPRVLDDCGNLRKRKQHRKGLCGLGQFTSPWWSSDSSSKDRTNNACCPQVVLISKYCKWKSLQTINNYYNSKSYMDKHVCTPSMVWEEGKDWKGNTELLSQETFSFASNKL